MVPHFINELRSRHCRVFAVEFEPRSNSTALLLRMRQACFRKWKLLILAERWEIRKDLASFPLFQTDGCI